MKPEYQLFVVALPFLSSLGIIVVAVLSTHYVWVATYSAYLESRINRLFGFEVLRAEVFARAFYAGWDSPVTVSYVLGFLSLVAVNFLEVPVINSQLLLLNRRSPFINP